MSLVVSKGINMRVNLVSGVHSKNSYNNVRRQTMSAPAASQEGVMSAKSSDYVIAEKNMTSMPAAFAGGGNRLGLAGSAGSGAVSNAAKITFTGDGINLNQLASITMENMGLGLPEAYQGGEGNVGYEMIKSFREHEKIDARSFMPFWEHDNQKGGFKFLIHREADFPNGFDASIKANGFMPAENFYSAELGETLEDVAQKLNLKTSELSYVIQSKPDGTGPKALSKYCILEPTSVKGEVVRLSDEVLGEVQKVPYALFKVSGNNPEYNKIKGEPHYFYYTPALARASRPYSYDKWGNTPFEAEIVNSDGMRALTKVIHSQMDTEEFGYFKPGNVILHDRTPHIYANYVANMSAAGDTSVNGIKYHIIEHNPGRNYQGTTPDPFKMLRIAADEADISALKSSQYYPILAKAQQYGIFSDALSPQEKKIAWAILEPALRPFRDGAGTYNMIKVGISAVRKNPENISDGTVSYTFGKEMRSPNMYDTAKFLTDDFASIETKDVLNGCMPSSMEFDKPDAFFGRDGNNGFYKNRSGFTTFKYNDSNIDEVVSAREKNTRWFSNLVAEAGEKGQDALNELFFSKGQIKDGHNVVGYISPVKEGEILDISWGRPVEQKGYTITTKGFLKFLMDPSVPLEDKLGYKVVIGAGPWNKYDPDFIEMMNDYKKICELEDGKFKHNLMIVDGWFSKRFAGCATYASLTSRREICGITPLECKTAGLPYAATNTGGPADYTNSSNGFLTKSPVEENPQKFGLTWDNSAEEIDRARIERSSDEMVDIFKAKVALYKKDRPGYIAMCKKGIEEKIDWHENAEFNMGKSANRRYLDDIFGVNEPIEKRNHNPLKRIMGAFGDFKDDVETMIEKSGKSKPAKAAIIILGSIAFVTGLYFIMKPKLQPETDKKIDKAA